MQYLKTVNKNMHSRHTSCM